MSPSVSRSYAEAQPVRKKSKMALQDTQSRIQKLEEIASRRGIAREVEADYIAWSIPKSPEEEPRGKAHAVKISLIGLCSPGSQIFSPITECYSPLSETRKLLRFTSTTETRCVRDIKRIFSWKAYGVAIDGNPKAQAHYVRISFADSTQDRAFEAIANLLDAIAAKRHVALENIHPFGIGMDSGVPEAHDRIYLISNCAKQTPALRRVVVDFEIYLDDEWKRLDLKVDRFGFATYKSTHKKAILVNEHEDIHFADDPFVRFARLTLRFGERPERAYIDIEGGEKSIPHVSRSRKSTIVYLPKVRVRTSDGSTTRKPIRTMTRLIFREREGFLRGSYGKYAAAEAEKLANLVKKTAALAAANALDIRSSVRDMDVVSMRLRRVGSQKGFVLTPSEDGSGYKSDIAALFGDCMLYVVPSHRAGGVTLLSQSRTGSHVLRQHVDNPVDLISSITAGGFSVSNMSTLVVPFTHERTVGTGTIHYSFKHGESDAGHLVDSLVKLLTSIDDQQRSPSRLPLLTKVLAQKQMHRSTAAGTTVKHSRSRAHLRTSSDASDASTDSEASSASSNREPSDWDIYEAPNTEVFEAPGCLGGAELSTEAIDNFLSELEGKNLCRAKKKYIAQLPREVDMEEGMKVQVEYKNNYWSFVKVVGAGEAEGWVPTAYLDVR